MIWTKENRLFVNYMRKHHNELVWHLSNAKVIWFYGASYIYQKFILYLAWRKFSRQLLKPFKPLFVSILKIINKYL